MIGLIRPNRTKSPTISFNSKKYFGNLFFDSILDTRRNDRKRRKRFYNITAIHINELYILSYRIASYRTIYKCQCFEMNRRGVPPPPGCAIVRVRWRVIKFKFLEKSGSPPVSRSYPVASLSCCIHVSYQSCLPGQEVGPSLSQVVKMGQGM